MSSALRQVVTLAAKVLTPVLLLAALFVVDRATPEDWPWWIDAGELVTPGTLRAVDLPLNESATPDADGLVRTIVDIRFEYLASAPPVASTWAVLIPRPLVSFELSANGAMIARRGQLTAPVSWLRWPKLVEIPQALLRPGENVLTLSGASELTRTYLPRLLVGPTHVLAPEHRRLRFFAVDVVRGVVIALALLAALVFGLFLLRPRDTVYGWFALTLLLWALHTAHDQLEAIPIASRHLWFALSYVELGWFVIVACVFVHRMLGLRPKKLETALWITGVAGTAALLLLAFRCGHCFYSAAQWAWVPLVNAIGLYTVGRLAVHAWRDRQPEFGWLLGAAWLALVVGVRDFLWEIKLLPWGSTYYLPYASALVLGVFAVILLRRFSAALSESERLNRDLEQRVATKAGELEDNYQALRETEGQRARLAERGRIMRDMHDNLGGHLVQALAIMDSTDSEGAAREAVQRCLTDLRVTLDASDIEGGDVVALIADFRHRIQRGLRRLGIELRLEMQDMPDQLFLGGDGAVHVLRIVQEAINNVVKHAAAEVVELRLQYHSGNPDRLEVTVLDNGCGLPAAPSAGRGLDNMRWRATTIGAELAVTAAKPGTLVRMIIPLSAASRDETG